MQSLLVTWNMAARLKETVMTHLAILLNGKKEFPWLQANLQGSIEWIMYKTGFASAKKFKGSMPEPPRFGASFNCTLTINPSETTVPLGNHRKAPRCYSYNKC